MAVLPCVAVGRNSAPLHHEALESDINKSCLLTGARMLLFALVLSRLGGPSLSFQVGSDMEEEAP